MYHFMVLFCVGSVFRLNSLVRRLNEGTLPPLKFLREKQTRERKTGVQSGRQGFTTTLVERHRFDHGARVPSVPWILSCGLLLTPHS